MTPTCRNCGVDLIEHPPQDSRIGPWCQACGMGHPRGRPRDRCDLCGEDAATLGRVELENPAGTVAADACTACRARIIRALLRDRAGEDAARRWDAALEDAGIDAGGRR